MYSSRPRPQWSKLKIATLGIISGTIILYNPLKNTLFIDYFVKKSSLISADHKIVTLPPDLHQFADDVRNDLRIKEKSRACVRFFLTKELDVTPIGNLNLSNGAKVGIPYTFTYEKVEDVDPKEVSSIIGEEKLIKSDWHKTEKGLKLIDSLVLSKEARKFAIARGIIAADSESIMLVDILTIFSIFAAISSYEFMEPHTRKFIGKFPSIIILASILTVVYSTVAMVTSEFARLSYEKFDDSRVLRSPNQDFKTGATEFYEKLIERNKSLRGLLIDGPKKFDSDGNPISQFTINSVSLKSRMDNCKNVIDTWKDDAPII